jgi:phosphonoacetaldehyde hydrolase
MRNGSQSIRLVVLDWAGTTIDFGSCAPAAAFAGVFARHGVDVTDEEARRPMGLSKREHLVSMLSEPAVAARWLAVHCQPWTVSDVDMMYHEFMPIQLDAIQRHADLVPNLGDVISELRSREIKIAGTTGYFREAAQAAAMRAAEAGFVPDTNACADDVPQGRPAPWMIYRVMESLGVWPPAAVVNVGDTIADIKAGLAAGCWSIGVCDSSSLMGVSQDEYSSMHADQKKQRLTEAENVFRDAGAHAVIHTLSELPSLVDELNEKRLPHPQALDWQPR